MSESNYRKMDGINQSLLKKIIIGPALAKARESDEYKEHYVLGQYTEDLIFNQNTSNYVVYDAPSGTTNLGKMVNWAIDFILSKNDNFSLDDFRIQYDSIGIKRPTVETLFEEVNIEISPILKFIGQEIKLIKPELEAKAQSAKLKVLSDFICGSLFKESDRYQTISKLPITWNYKDILCKGELDFIRVDHESRQIRIFDIKTLFGYNYNLEWNFWKFRYDFQLSYYQYGFQNSEYFKNNFQDYTLRRPMILAIDFITDVPLLYEVLDTTLIIGQEGGVTPRGYQVKGWKEALELHSFYEKHGYTYPKDVVLNKFLTI
jgi:hypothetical protein